MVEKVKSKVKEVKKKCPLIIKPDLKRFKASKIDGMLEMIEEGYRAAKEGKKLVLNLGYSHPVFFEETNDIKFDLPNNTTIVVSGINKQIVGEVAAQIRSKRPPEPYLGKGIKYTGEHIRRKAGKAGK